MRPTGEGFTSIGCYFGFHPTDTRVITFMEYWKVPTIRFQKFTVNKDIVILTIKIPERFITGLRHKNMSEGKT